VASNGSQPPQPERQASDLLDPRESPGQEGHFLEAFCDLFGVQAALKKCSKARVTRKSFRREALNVENTLSGRGAPPSNISTNSAIGKN
jgi:hypothetical protein